MKSLILSVTLPLAAIGMLACSGKDSDTGTTGTTGEPPCDVEIDDTIPASGATDAYYRNAIQFELSDPDPTAVLSVDGVDGTSSLNDDEDVVTFTPSSPLASGTAYTATLDYCTGSASVDFQTSELGGAVDPAGLIGGAYALDLSTGRIVIPEGVGDILAAYLEYTIFLGVTDADSSKLQMMGALANEDDTSQQDYCTPSLSFPEADFSDAPYFQIGPETTTLAVAGFEITIDELLVSGDFAPDGTWVGGAQLAGSIDTRPLVGLLDDDPEAPEDTVCELVAGFGVECIPCGDGQNFCLDLLVLDLVADLQSGLTLEEIDAEDCHASCPDSAANPDCPEFYTGG